MADMHTADAGAPGAYGCIYHVGTDVMKGDRSSETRITYFMDSGCLLAMTLRCPAHAGLPWRPGIPPAKS